MRLFNGWRGIREDIHVNAFKDGERVPDDSYLISTMEGGVCLLDRIDGQLVKRPIPQLALFENYFFNFGTVYKIPPAILATIPDGDALT